MEIQKNTKYILKQKRNFCLNTRNVLIEKNVSSIKPKFTSFAALLSGKCSCIGGREMSALTLAFRQLIVCSAIFKNGEYGGSVRRCAFSLGCSERRWCSIGNKTLIFIFIKVVNSSCMKLSEGSSCHPTYLNTAK